MANVLLVDDDSMLLNAMTRGLREGGHDVTACSGGRAAIATLREKKSIDLVCTDLFMPDGDGYEVIIALQKIAPSMPVIAMSGLSAKFTPYLNAARMLGAVHILQKPFS